MKPADATRILVLMAHPDDEFALFPWISAARAAGASLRCVWLTDGAWGGQDPSRRENESACALRALGVGAEALDFAGRRLAIGDGTLHLNAARALEGAGAAMRDACLDGEVWCPAWEGGHQDHDACHVIAHWVAARASARIRQFPIYHGAGLRGPWFRVMSPLAANGDAVALPVGASDRIASIVRCLGYRSQWRSFLGLLPFYALRMLHRTPFVLQDASRARLRQRPHAGALLYERRGATGYGEFVAGMRPVLEALDP